MKTALVLNAINPGIGGVLIRGQRGTAKSTAVRALARLLPEIDVIAGCRYRCDPAAPATWCDDCQARAASGVAPVVERRRMRVVELPVNASEDRVRRHHRHRDGDQARRTALRAGAPRRRQPGHPLRGRGEPPRRPHRRCPAGRRRDGVERRGARGHLVLAPIAVHPRRDHEPGGGRPPPAAPGSFRAVRRHHGAPRSRRAGPHHGARRAPERGRRRAGERVPRERGPSQGGHRGGEAPAPSGGDQPDHRLVHRACLHRRGHPRPPG